LKKRFLNLRTIIYRLFKWNPVIFFVCFILLIVLCGVLLVLLMEPLKRPCIANEQMDQWVLERHTELNSITAAERAKEIECVYEGKITVQLWEICENNECYYDIIVLKKALFNHSRIVATFWIPPQKAESFMMFGFNDGLFNYIYSVSADWNKLYGPDKSFRFFK